MATFAAGIGGGQQKTLIGGTLSANPMSCAAGYYAIKAMAETDAPLRAARAADRLVAGLTAVIEEMDCPFFVYNHASIVHLETHGVLLVDMSDPEFFVKVFERKHIAEEIGAAFTAEGVITVAGSRIYTSMADTDDVIDDAVQRLARVIGNMEAMS